MNIFEIKKSNNGLGMFATQKIQRGQIIISESPLFKVPEFVNLIDYKKIDSIISKLSDEKKETFFDLFDYHTNKSPIGILQTNALPLGKDAKIGAIFPLISRINHSCKPNVCHTWCQSEGVEKIFALKNIEPGDEILTSYIHLYADKATRKMQLMDKFKFDCKCELCSLDEEKSKLSDVRRRKLEDLDDSIPQIALFLPEIAISKANEIIKLLKEEDIFYDSCYVIRAAYDIFSIYYQTKASANILKFWADFVYDNSMICQGEVMGLLKSQVIFYHNKK